MGCGASSGEGRHKGTKLTADVVTELSASPTIWVGNIPSGFGHINSLGIAMVRALTEKELVAAFSEFGEVVSVSLRKKGGEFDAKSWALVTFSQPEAAGRALFGKTVVVDEAYDEVELQVKRADLFNANTTTKGALGAIAASQAQQVKATKFAEGRQRRMESVEAKRAKARADKMERRARENEGNEPDLDPIGWAVEKPQRRLSTEASFRERGGRHAQPAQVEGILPMGKKKKGKYAAKAGNGSSGDGNGTRRTSGGNGGVGTEAGGGGAAAQRKRRAKTISHVRRRSTGAVSADSEDENEEEEDRGEGEGQSGGWSAMVLDRTTLWSTAWVGGIPAMFVRKHPEIRLLRLFKSFGKVVRVTVRHKPDEGSTYKCWAFITFAEARAVGAAQSDPPTVSGEGYGPTTLKVKPAAVSTKLKRNENNGEPEGALRRIWDEQQNKVISDTEAHWELNLAMMASNNKKQNDKLGRSKSSAINGGGSGKHKPMRRQRRNSVIGRIPDSLKISASGTLLPA